MLKDLKRLLIIDMQEVEVRRKSMEASTLEKLAEKERRAEEVRAKKANMPPMEGEGTS